MIRTVKRSTLSALLDRLLQTSPEHLRMLRDDMVARKVTHQARFFRDLSGVIHGHVDRTTAENSLCAVLPYNVIDENA